LIAHHLAFGSPSGHLVVYDRGLGLIVGSGIALLLTEWAPPGLNLWLSRRGSRSVVIVANVLLLTVAAVVPQRLVFGPLLPLISLAFSVLVASMWVGPVDGWGRALSWKPLSFAGRISYGIYLFHMIAHYLTWQVVWRGIDHWPRVAKFGLRFSTFVVLALAIAWLSYTFLEKRFLALKDRFRPRPGRPTRPQRS
jgi:peptidoglycan/LPS O-acetylase OafA/YrhL